MLQKIITKNEQQTFNLGKKLAKKLKGGEIIALSGNLGAGKTVFVKGLAAGLGIKKPITSPTFVLLKIYNTNLHEFTTNLHKSENEIKLLCHIDAYRLTDAQELVDIGVLDYFNRLDCVCVVEWADRVKDILPRKRIDIVFKHGKKENERLIKISSNS